MLHGEGEGKGVSTPFSAPPWRGVTAVPK